MDLLDTIVLAGYGIAVVVIGLLAGRGQSRTDDYLMGGRSVPWLAGMASVIATGISCRSLIGLPGLTYARDLTYLQMYLVAPLAAWLAAVTLLPKFTSLRITSAYQFLGRRFGPRAQSFGSALFQIETAVVLGTVIAAPCLVLSEATGMPYVWSVIVFMGATVLYTSFGGIRAVIWTDVLQFGVFTIVPVLIVAYGISSLDGGLATVLAAARQHDKLRVFDFSFDFSSEMTFWAALVSMVFWHGSTQGSNQVIIQRYMTAPSPAECRKTMLWGSVGTVLLWALFLLIGILLFAYSTAHPGLLPGAKEPDRVFTAFVMKVLPGGLRGAYIAAALAAGMSTLSGMLNSLSTVTLVDIWKLHFDDGASDAVWVRRARGLTLMWGAFSFGAAFFVLRFGTVITAGVKLGSILAGALLGMFLLGAFVRRANTTGAIAGACLGICAVVGVMAAGSVSWSWFCGIGTVVTVIAGYLASLTAERAAAAPRFRRAEGI